MTRREKALLTLMADNLDSRARNSRSLPSGPNDPHSVGHAEGAAYAFHVAAEYLRGIRDGHERGLPKLKDLETSYGG